MTGILVRMGCMVMPALQQAKDGIMIMGNELRIGGTEGVG